MCQRTVHKTSLLSVPCQGPCSNVGTQRSLSWSRGTRMCAHTQLGFKHLVLASGRVSHANVSHWESFPAVCCTAGTGQCELRSHIWSWAGGPCPSDSALCWRPHLCQACRLRGALETSGQTLRKKPSSAGAFSSGPKPRCHSR